MIQQMGANLQAVTTSRPTSPVVGKRVVEEQLPQDGLVLSSPSEAGLFYPKFAHQQPAAPPQEILTQQEAMQLQYDMQEKTNYVATVARNLSHLPGMDGPARPGQPTLGTLLTDVYFFSGQTPGQLARDL